MGGIEVDGREVKQLELDLSKAPLRVQFAAGRSTRQGLRILDEAMTIDATGHKGNWFGRPGTTYGIDLQKHVSHEMTGPMMGEAGIETGGSGSLAHIIVHGSVNNGPAYDYMTGPRRVMGDILEKYADAAEDSVLGGTD
jgi:hypothetical protein